MHDAQRVTRAHSMLHRAVGNKNDDTVRRNLAVVTPADGLDIEVHGGVGTEPYHRVAYHLHVVSPYSHAVVCPHTAVEGVGLRTVRIMYLFGKECVRVYVRDMCRVRPVDHERAVRRIPPAVLLPHLAVLARECRLSGRVGHRHASHNLSEPDALVVIDSVAGHQFAVLVVNGGTVQQHGPLAMGVVPATGRVYVRFLFVNNIGRADYICYFGVRVIEQRVSREDELGVGQHHVPAEYSLLGPGAVVAANGYERVERVLDGSSGEIIRYSRCPVVIEAVGCEDGRVLVRTTVDHTDVTPHTRHFGVAVVEQFVPVPLQGVSLHETHMTERVQGVRLLVEIRTVAVHERLFVPENDIVFEYLRVGYPFLVETKVPSTLQIHHRLAMAHQSHY